MMKEYYMNYALKIFKSGFKNISHTHKFFNTIADEDDKEGKATKKTAKDFLHADIFLEAYDYFESPIPDDVSLFFDLILIFLIFVD